MSHFCKVLKSDWRAVWIYSKCGLGVEMTVSSAYSWIEELEIKGKSLIKIEKEVDPALNPGEPLLVEQISHIYALESKQIVFHYVNIM